MQQDGDEEGSIDVAMKILGTKKPTDLVYASDADGDDDPSGALLVDIEKSGRTTWSGKEPGFISVAKLTYKGYPVVLIKMIGSNVAFALKSDV